jgi:hypothetical protein
MNSPALLPMPRETSSAAAPQCGVQSWHQRLTYRECLRCRYKDGPPVQEILDEGNRGRSDE